MSLTDSVWTSQDVSVNNSVVIEDALRWNGDRIAAYTYVGYVRRAFTRGPPQGTV